MVVVNILPIVSDQVMLFINENERVFFKIFVGISSCLHCSWILKLWE